MYVYDEAALSKLLSENEEIVVDGGLLVNPVEFNKPLSCPVPEEDPCWIINAKALNDQQYLSEYDSAKDSS